MKLEATNREGGWTIHLHTRQVDEHSMCFLRFRPVLISGLGWDRWSMSRPSLPGASVYGCHCVATLTDTEAWVTFKWCLGITNLIQSERWERWRTEHLHANMCNATPIWHSNTRRGKPGVKPTCCFMFGIYPKKCLKVTCSALKCAFLLGKWRNFNWNMNTGWGKE